MGLGGYLAAAESIGLLYYDWLSRIWLIDLAKQYPDVKLDGYDISTKQYPVAARLPKNVTLDVLDILKPIPEHLRGTYDVVHVKIIVLVVQKDNPLPILDNLLALLSITLPPDDRSSWTDSVQSPVVTCIGMSLT